MLTSDAWCTCVCVCARLLHMIVANDFGYMFVSSSIGFVGAAHTYTSARTRTRTRKHEHTCTHTHTHVGVFRGAWCSGVGAVGLVAWAGQEDLLQFVEIVGMTMSGLVLGQARCDARGVTELGCFTRMGWASWQARLGVGWCRAHSCRYVGSIVWAGPLSKRAFWRMGSKGPCGIVLRSVAWGRHAW